MPRNKLTDNDVIEIRVLCQQGDKSYSKIAEAYGVSFTTIWNVMTGKSYKHLPIGKRSPRPLGVGKYAARGSRSANAVLTEEFVREIRRRYVEEESITQRQLAAEYGISQTNLRSVLERKSWRHVE